MVRATAPTIAELDLDQVLANRPNGGLGPTAHADLPQDVLNVLLDGLVANTQFLGNHLVRLASRHFPQHLKFPLCQRKINMRTIWITLTVRLCLLRNKQT